MMVYTKHQPPLQMFTLLIGALNHYDGGGGGVGLSGDNWVRKMGWLPSPAADAAVSR